jgi:hypothetical protein
MAGGEFDADLEEGDQAMATYPARAQIDRSLPDIYKKPNKGQGQAPAAQLELKWAHGFRSFDTRGNLAYSSDSNIVFTTAGVGVVYNKLKDSQSFFTLHGEDIVAMAMHPNG